MSAAIVNSTRHISATSASYKSACGIWINHLAALSEIAAYSVLNGKKNSNTQQINNNFYGGSLFCYQPS